MSLNQMRVLGIDVAKAKMDIALRLPDGKFRSEVIANTPEGFEKLAAWLEATGIYWESAALSRTKTDKKDVRLIVRFCAERKPPLWEPSPSKLAELRAVVTRSDALEHMRTQEINRPMSPALKSGRASNAISRILSGRSRRSTRKFSGKPTATLI